MTDSLEEIQSRDRTDTITATVNRLEDKLEKEALRESRELEAEVRELITATEEALVGTRPELPSEFTDTLFEVLWADPDRPEVVNPRTDRLENSVKMDVTLARSRRDRGERPPPKWEFPKVIVPLAKALGYLGAVSDKTRYAPITLEHLDRKGARSSVPPDEVLPIGRKRIGHDSSASIENIAEAIPHASCDHILTVASPRQGKDATNARICGNLKDQHGYKWVSILDDGRNELPMIAIPNDEDAIRQSLDQLGQEPKAYETRVYVPAMPGLPDRLPGNFVPFTIGVDTLTPEIVLRLAGGSANANTERRIRQALEAAERGGGKVEDVVEELKDLAGEMETTVTVANESDDEQTFREFSYQWEEDAALQQAASTIAQYAGDGLIADVGADTNLDMSEILEAQDRVAVLNCNFLEPGNGALHYIIMDLWMQLIWHTVDERKTVPRVAMEIRELKNVAHSQPHKTKYPEEVSSTQQTIYEIASQGGSRGIMLVGSTQKVNDVDRSVRVNMRNKIVLSNEDEGIATLNESLDLDGLDEVIKGFDPGQGLVATPGWKRWPVQFTGARCGLGMKDRGWLDRYGIAMGARVREDPHDHWRKRHADVDWWVEINDVEIHDGDEGPAIRDYYSDWYLLDEDFPDGTTRDDVDEALVLDVLEERREYPLADDLRLRDVSELELTREVQIRDAEEAEEERLQDRLEELGVPTVLEPWLETSSDKRRRMKTVLQTVREEQPRTQQAMTEGMDLSGSTVGDYISDDDSLGACVVKNEESGRWELTPMGEKALEIDWHKIVPD